MLDQVRWVLGDWEVVWDKYGRGDPIAREASGMVSGTYGLFGVSCSGVALSEHELLRQQVQQVRGGAAPL